VGGAKNLLFPTAMTSLPLMAAALIRELPGRIHPLAHRLCLSK